jgi:hypothetical protein
MRYYFHLRIGQKLSLDDIGLELPDLETAYLEAFEAAQTMWGELLSERSDPLIRSFEIEDEYGQPLLTLPFSEVLDRARKPSPPCLSARSSEASSSITVTRRYQTLAGRLQERIETTREKQASLQDQIAVVRETVEAARKTLARSRRQTERWPFP